MRLWWRCSLNRRPCEWFVFCVTSEEIAPALLISWWCGDPLNYHSASMLPHIGLVSLSKVWWQYKHSLVHLWSSRQAQRYYAVISFSARRAAQTWTAPQVVKAHRVKAFSWETSPELPYAAQSDAPGWPGPLVDQWPCTVPLCSWTFDHWEPRGQRMRAFARKWGSTAFDSRSLNGV